MTGRLLKEEIAQMNLPRIVSKVAVIMLMIGVHVLNLKIGLGHGMDNPPVSIEQDATVAHPKRMEITISKEGSELQEVVGAQNAILGVR